MAKPIGGPEGPGVTRPSGPVPEDRAPVSLGERLDRLQTGFRDTGRLPVEVRQGEGRDVPTDRSRTRQRQEAMDSFKAEFLREVGESWSDFVAAFADRPDPDRTDRLSDALADYARAPDRFLRGDSGFLSALTEGLRQGGAEALLQDVTTALSKVPGPHLSRHDAEPTRLSGEAAHYVARLTEVIVETVLGGADRLPQDFLSRLREAGAEILRADLTPSQKTDALCQLCKGAICQHGLGPGLMTAGGPAGHDAAAKCFMIILSTGVSQNLSPDLAKALGPLAQSLPSRLEDFMRALGMPTVEG